MRNQGSVFVVGNVCALPGMLDVFGRWRTSIARDEARPSPPEHVRASRRSQPRRPRWKSGAFGFQTPIRVLVPSSLRRARLRRVVWSGIRFRTGRIPGASPRRDRMVAPLDRKRGSRNPYWRRVRADGNPDPGHQQGRGERLRHRRPQRNAIPRLVPPRSQWVDEVRHRRHPSADRSGRGSVRHRSGRRPRRGRRRRRSFQPDLVVGESPSQLRAFHAVGASPDQERRSQPASRLHLRRFRWRRSWRVRVLESGIFADALSRRNSGQSQGRGALALRPDLHHDRPGGGSDLSRHRW